MSDEPTNKDLVNADKAKEQMGKVPWIAHTLVSIGILFVAFSIVGSMFATKPEARKWGGRPAPAVTVETTQLAPTDYQVWIDSYGSATPLTMTNLVSDVSGRVIEVSESIRAGSSFDQGEVLLRIEPRDYQIAVDVAEAAVADAEVRYQQEQAEAEIARQEWNIRPSNNKGQALALREPQVKAARAALQSAKARLDQAKLDLERTEVKAPFAGKVLSQMVDLGQVVSPSQAIAEIYATEQLEIRLPIKTQDLHQFDLAMLNNPEALPRVVLESNLGNQTYQWYGEIVRSEGAYDRNNRMLYVVARVQDPFTATETSPAMRVGQFFEARIEGRLLTNVFTLPRRAVSQENLIAVVDESQLLKMPVEPLWTDRDMVVVQAMDSLEINTDSERRFSQADQLILTPTANLVSGTRVRLIGEETRRPGRGPRTADNETAAKSGAGQSAQ